jgi:uncharacterized protein YcbK (DUF882 family)
MPIRLGRRRFLVAGAATAMAGLTSPAFAYLGAGPGIVPGTVPGSVPGMGANPSGARALAFESLHTGEKLAAEYWANGRYVPDALREIDHVLRDFRTGEVHAIDPDLLDLLHRLHAKLGSEAPFQVISGYRSPATNAALHAGSDGVAVHSLHLQGMAIDIRLADRPLDAVHRAALDLSAGGVGYYPQSDFVHVDVGRVRRWAGA